MAPAGPPTPARTRDAERSPAAILDAAEQLFAARGFEASLGEIGAAAGVSRGTPSYFYGSKEELHAAVLARAFAAREAAVSEAFAPLRAWAAAAPRANRPPASGLSSALAAAVGGYVAFLHERPTFVRLVEWETVAGGGRLRATPHESTAVEAGLRALRAAGPRRGIRRFDVTQAVIAFVSLCFTPHAQRDTLLPALGVDLDDPAFRRAHERQVVDVLLHLVRARPPDRR